MFGLGARDGAAPLAAVLDTLPAATVVIDGSFTMLAVNAAWRRAGGTMLEPGSEISLDGDSYPDALDRVLPPPERARLVTALRGLRATGEPTEVLRFAVSGASGVVWTQWQAAALPEDAGPGGALFVVTHTDITELVRREQELAWRAGHDDLTGLPGRSRLHELVGEVVDAGAGAAVLFLDVDGFKNVNDSLGHRAGDELLTQVAARLERRTRPGDVVGRVGGDEFLVLARDCDVDGAVAIAERLRAAFEEPFLLGVERVSLTASVGISVTPCPSGAAAADDGEPPADGLIGDADAAMYAAKSAGRDRTVVFSTELRQAARWRLEVSSRLGDPATYAELVVHYQPIVHLPSDRITGLEALVRWQHPRRGLLLPDEFVPLAEETGTVVPMSRWLLHEVCRQGAAWSAAGTPVVIGVNVSARHFGAGTLVQDVVAALTAAGLPPSQLVLELTETALADEPHTVAAQLLELDALGVSIAVDDFGTGWSTLARLLALPLDTLKIDRSLLDAVDGMSTDQAHGVMAAIVALADTLGIRALAEGVETPAHLARVRAAGCVFAQGWLFGRPVPAEELGPMLDGVGEPWADVARAG
ncbi:EAL domain-containing protein [Geodermatophilaceae bacterium NBWT11]|nr:EAL domain-containing protein [Geodermatophilaceae bacterium NBWT11]